MSAVQDGQSEVRQRLYDCGLEGVDVVLGNTFLHYYDMEIRQRPSVYVVMVGLDGKPKPLPFTKTSGARWARNKSSHERSPL